MKESQKSERTYVLVSYNRPRTRDNHFVNLFAQSVATDKTHIRYFSARNVVFGRIDVFSLHWPELLTKGSSWTRQIAKYGLLLILLSRLFISRIPVIYTVHNEVPHEKLPSKLGQLLYEAVVRRVHFNVYLNEASTNAYNEGCVILHGRYPVGPDSQFTTKDSAATILCFGNIRPYKGIELVIKTAKVTDTASASFSVVGSGSDDSYLNELRALGRRVEGLSLQFAYLDDATLLSLIRRSSAVMLPYRNMYNSGAALLALSASRPIIVPNSPANVALAEEVGRRWVTLLDPSSSEDDWSNAVLASLRDENTLAGGLPDLSRRSWSEIGMLYRRIFSEARTLRSFYGLDGFSARMRRFVESSSDFTNHSERNSACARPSSGDNVIR